jgi:hypothetical protein
VVEVLKVFEDQVNEVRLAELEGPGLDSFLYFHAEVIVQLALVLNLELGGNVGQCARNLVGIWVNEYAVVDVYQEKSSPAIVQALIDNGPFETELLQASVQMNRPRSPSILASINVLANVQAEILRPSIEFNALGDVDEHIFSGYFRLGVSGFTQERARVKDTSDLADVDPFLTKIESCEPSASPMPMDGE